MLIKLMELAAENAQASTVIFDDAKDLQSLVRWTILHAMTGAENYVGFVRLKAERGCFAAGSSPEQTPAQIESKMNELRSYVAKGKAQIDHEAHD